jgi:hypothetical protein
LQRTPSPGLKPGNAPLLLPQKETHILRAELDELYSTS